MRSARSPGVGESGVTVGAKGLSVRWEHRRQWVEERLRELAGVFAVEIAAYAVMSDHVLVVQRMAPEIIAT